MNNPLPYGYPIVSSQIPLCLNTTTSQVQYCGARSSPSSRRSVPTAEVPLHRLLTCRTVVGWRALVYTGGASMSRASVSCIIKDTQQCTWSTPGGGLALRYTPPHSCWSRMSSHGRGVGDMHRVKVHRESYRLYLIYLYCFTECALHVHSLLKNISPTVQDDSKQTLTLCAAVLCKLRLRHNPLKR